MLFLYILCFFLGHFFIFLSYRLDELDPIYSTHILYIVFQFIFTFLHIWITPKPNKKGKDVSGLIILYVWLYMILLSLSVYFSFKLSSFISN